MRPGRLFAQRPAPRAKGRPQIPRLTEKTRLLPFPAVDAVLATAVIASTLLNRPSPGKQPASPDKDLLRSGSLSDVLALPVQQLGHVDPARVNRFCAERMPGAEDFGPAQILGALDKCARHVRPPRSPRPKQEGMGP